MPARRPRHALVVDDNPHARLILVRLLEALGFAVTAAESGAAAIDLAASNGFDIAFIDIEMPDMDGHETAAALRDAVPILVAVTGHDVTGIAGPFSAALMKPVGVEALAATLRKVLPASV